MPNTPARLGRGMTVWYATPKTTEAQRAQAAALLGSLGAQIEVDDEKFVAMATAVSGTGPTYVFLVMEALIDAAVHLGFPRHVAHDLVIETLEGSTVFAKQSGMHPAELRNMVTSPGGTSAAALHELESGRLRTVLSEAVWAAYRRTVELGEQLEASVGVRGGRHGPHDVSLVGIAPAIDLRRAPLVELRAVDMRAPERDFWADEVALWDRLVSTWAGLDDAAWRIPGASTSDAGGPDWSLAEHVGHLAAWQGLAEVYTQNAIATGRWPSDEEFDGGDFDKFNERLREPWRSLSSDAIVARFAASRRGLLRQANRLTASAIRGDNEWGWVYLALHGHYLDHLTVIETWTAALRARQADGDPFVAGPADARPRHLHGARRAREHDPRGACSRSCRSTAGRPSRSRPAGRSATTSPTWPTGPRRAPGPSRSTATSAAGWPTRSRASTPGTSGWSSAPGRSGRWPRSPGTSGRARRCTTPSRPSAWPSCGRRTAGAGRTTASTGTSASTSRSSDRGAPRRPGRTRLA